ncbi:crosslink repair DNA glycosylase YcaQ family protein [Paraglaciecola sp. 20A4]|uniref:winged helix-turn-helix domain-containing protein n=1 Tax=Paraglaciecola sp. 20A4 TaxID=2687288 RepID=UPI00140DEBDD|nr:crosslink repair DNA glycosylase YcaQ family protein [Paraglaciecola sp. 20A4]
MAESISQQQARKLVLHAQRLPTAPAKGNAITATLNALEAMGYVQIDTISVIERAHHHTLWNRNPKYQPHHLEQLIAQKHVFEYWSHAAAYLPMRDYRFTLIRKEALKSGELDHWYPRNPKLMTQVLSRIRNEGPLKAKNFDNGASRLNKIKSGDWSSKPAKQALECLFMQGDLMIVKRDKFHKVYELTERVLPADINSALPSQEEYSRFLITRFLHANGIGQASEIAYLRKNTKNLIQHQLNIMQEEGTLITLDVAGNYYFCLPEHLNSLNMPLRRKKMHILSPFDNLLIQRKRMRTLFEFDYLLECYLPQAKRQYGYFALPILWDAQLVARMDCRVDRKDRILHIYHLVLEPSLSKKVEAFHLALATALKTFLTLNHCHDFVLHKTTQLS